MSMILDAAVIVLLVLVTYHYAKKGIVKVLVGIAGFVISLAAATVFCRPVGNLIHPFIADKVDKIDASESLINKFASAVLGSSAVATVIAFGVIFLVCLIICKLVSLLINDIAELPVLSDINHLVGGILGFALGFAYAEILSLVFFCFSEYLIGTFDWLTAEAYESSIIAKWMFENNIFTYVYSLI
jgi:uncharacterized membrane protein required for colicin V production